MKVGLYFGSFNPIHIGHLIIAEHIANHTDFDQVWLVVSPQNPLKPSSVLLNEYQRLHLANLAIEGNGDLRVSDIEFKLPKPSYTIDTLTYLKEKYPTTQFAIILGSDSFQNLKRWKNYEALLNNYQFVVYERPGYTIEETYGGTVQLLKAPLLQISSTEIRKLIKEGKSIQYLVPDKVRAEIDIAGYYK